MSQIQNLRKQLQMLLEKMEKATSSEQERLQARIDQTVERMLRMSERLVDESNMTRRQVEHLPWFIPSKPKK